MKGAIESYVIVDDDGKDFHHYERDKFNDFIEKNEYSVASNGVLYRQDKVGVIPEILNVWFDKRVEYKDQMKKFGKAGNDEKYKFLRSTSVSTKDYVELLIWSIGITIIQIL